MSLAKAQALLCCDVIEILYAMIDDWVDAKRPVEGSFNWNPPATIGPITKLSPLIWGEALAYRRRPGPRERYHWIREWSPIALAGLDPAGVLYVIFRGTSIHNEWDTNFRFPTRPLALADQPFGEAHDGFADSYESMEEDLFQALADFSTAATQPIKQIVVSGHSLGGAIATLAFAGILKSPWFANVVASDVAGVVFGSPRVGAPSFKVAFDALQRSFVRVENTVDLATQVPPEQVLFWKYTHVGVPMVFTNDLGSARPNHMLATYRHAVEQAWEGAPGARS